MVQRNKENKDTIEKSPTREGVLELTIRSQADHIAKLVFENANLKTLHRIREKKINELTAERDRLITLSETDPLTGLGNRRAFEKSMNHSINIALRGGTPLSLVCFDVVGLKRINDTISGWAGDELIKAASRAIARPRSTDTFFRSSDHGDEFYAILPLVDGKGVQGYLKNVMEATRTESVALKELLMAKSESRTKMVESGLNTENCLLKLYTGFAVYQPNSMIGEETGHISNKLMMSAQTMLNKKKKNSHTSRDSILLRQ